MNDQRPAPVHVPGPTALRAVLGGAFAKGMDYARRGQVLGVWWETPAGPLAARVQGTEDEPYQCRITWSDLKGRLEVEGECSCPVGFNCKHVAAALIQANIRPPSDHPPDEAEVPPPVLSMHAPDQRMEPDWQRQVRQPFPGAPPRASRSPFERWRDALKSAVEPGRSAAPPPDVPERLLYLLSPDPDVPVPRGVQVQPVVARALKGGGFSTPKPLNNGPESQARYVTDGDRRLLSLMRAQQSPGAGFRVEQDWGVELLRKLLDSGRCHWLDVNTPALRSGPERRGQFMWDLGADAHSRPRLDVPNSAAVLPLAPPWYVDTRAQLAGPVETGLPPGVCCQLLLAPPLAPADATQLLADWGAALGEWSQAVPAPPQPRIDRRKGIKPVPVFELSRTLLRRYYGPEEWFDVGRLSFDYDGVRAPPGGADQALMQVDGDRVIEITRSPDRENKASQNLRSIGILPMQDDYGRPMPYWVPNPTVGRAGWIDFLAVQAPKLREKGWRIEVAEDFPWRLHEPDDIWDADIEEGRDWFDLALDVMVDGTRTKLLPLLVALLHQTSDRLDLPRLKALSDDAPVVIRDEHGRLIRLPAGRIKPILGTLLELYDERPLSADGRLRLPRNAGMLLDGLGEHLRYSGGGTVRELAERLRGVSGLDPVEPPAGLQGELRDYQRHGLSWLQFLRRMDLAGVLADDMGLGKTVQTLAHVLLEKEQGRLDRPALVIAPTSLMFNWRREAGRFAPALRVLVLHGLDRRRDFERITEHDLVLSTYPLLARDIEVLKAQPWHLLVLDEAQNIKNAKSKSAQLVAQLDTRHRLALTGTPLENHLGELWSLFHFLMPGYLADERAFRRRFRTPIEKHGDAEVRTQLARRIAPFLLRRTKQEVASELPPRTEIIRSVALEGAQRDLYETVRAAMQEKVRREIEQRGLARSQIVVLDALLKLRQICCDPRLLKMESARSVRESAKLDLLMNLLPEMLDEGRRVLLFSQFTSMLALIEEELKARGIAYLKLTGDTKDRQSLVDRFQKQEVPLFLISLKAGGVGLNLTAADTVIHYDPWWNPAVENQATDRAHRIGQDKPVFVYKLYTENTVEEKIAALQAVKRELADALFGEGTAGTIKLDGETLAKLFDPLA
ncbi:MAG: DEAD/DEAH box helicase [Panacagrimonas sp.]